MGKILVADDDHAMVSLLRTMISMNGYQVLTLLDRKGDIIQNMKDINPNVLIMDIFLGDRNGLDLIQSIRSEPDLENTKIIMVSGMDKSQECLAAGADAFLIKPYMPEELLTLLHDFCQNN